MSKRERDLRSLSKKEFDDLIRQRTLDEMDKKGLSVTDALRGRLSPFIVAERAITLQDYFDVASAVIDPLGTEGLHPAVRQKQLSFHSVDRDTAFLTSGIAMRMIRTSLEEDIKKSKNPLDIQERLLMLVESALIPSR